MSVWNGEVAFNIAYEERNTWTLPYGLSGDVPTLDVGSNIFTVQYVHDEINFLPVDVNLMVYVRPIYVPTLPTVITNNPTVTAQNNVLTLTGVSSSNGAALQFALSVNGLPARSWQATSEFDLDNLQQFNSYRIMVRVVGCNNPNNWVAIAVPTDMHSDDTGPGYIGGPGNGYHGSGAGMDTMTVVGIAGGAVGAAAVCGAAIWFFGFRRRRVL